MSVFKASEMVMSDVNRDLLYGLQSQQEQSHKDLLSVVYNKCEGSVSDGVRREKPVPHFVTSDS